jgi:hypothetical protein
MDTKPNEVEEVEVTPIVIDRPKPKPLKEEKPREESPVREIIQPVDQTLLLLHLVWYPLVLVFVFRQPKI